MRSKLFSVSLTVAVLSCATAFAQMNTYTLNPPENLLSNTYFGNTNPQSNPNVLSRSFVDPVTNVAVSFDLEYMLDWVTTVTGLTGFAEDANVGVGAVTNGFANSAELEDLNINGVQALERLTINVTNIVATNGSATLNGFKNATVTSTADVITNGISSIPVIPLTATAVSGGNGGRLTGFDIEFKTTAIPEPSQFMLLGLVGLFLSGRSWYRRRIA